MYAMLTGFLPYMMEPFNVMEMYEKMMQRKMTPVPGFLSKGKISFSYQVIKIREGLIYTIKHIERTAIYEVRVKRSDVY